LRLDDLKGPLVFVGDESSFALVGAWQTQHVDEQPVSVVCEVDDAHESSEVLGAIGISGQPSRPASGRNPRPRTRGVGREALRGQPDAALCLTGKAQTIAAVRQAIKSAGLSRRPTQVTAYWDENRSGLD
jgi:NADPH-dependent ferric siderophore reductase